MPNFFDAVGDSFDEAVDAVADHADDGVDTVAETVDATVDGVSKKIADAAPAGPISLSGDASIGEFTPIPNVGPMDFVTEAPSYELQGPEGSVRLGQAEIDFDIDNAAPGQGTVLGGVVVGGTRVTIDIDGPGVDGTFTAEGIFTVNPGVIVVTPRVGGPAFGGSAEVVVNPSEMPAPKIDLVKPAPPRFTVPTLDDIDLVLEPPAPPTPIPIPYPTIGTFEEPKRSVEYERDLPFEGAVAASSDKLRAEAEMPEVLVPEVLLPEVDASGVLLPEVDAVPEVEVTLDETPVVDFAEPEPSQFQDDLSAIDAAEAELDIFG